ncbi:MAG TPA: cysteine rich repeat-containing protein [Hyphomicrobiaceae bacterium]|nr:cysteine rich repeat-containing protein [Hyphomicrobiaceae bacterium]
MTLPSFFRPTFRAAHALVAAALLLTPGLAQAQLLERRPGLAFARAALEVCGGDVSRVCGGVAPGGGRIAQCLISQQEKLSPDCRRFVTEAKSAQNTMFACASDAKRLCATTLPGGGRVVACLSRQRDAISRDCARALDEAAALSR